MLPEPVVGVGQQTGREYFTAAEDRPEMASVNGPRVDFTPMNTPPYSQQPPMMPQPQPGSAALAADPTAFAQLVEAVFGMRRAAGRQPQMRTAAI